MHLKLIGTALKSKTGRKILIIGLGAALLMSIIMMLLPVIAIAGIIEPINSAVESIQTGTADFFNKLDHFLKGEGWSTDEEAFIRTFQKKSNYYRDKGVTINGALIMSTLMTKQLYIGENPAEQDLGEDYENFDEARADVMSIPYGNMIGDMRKLVEHQVNKVFSLPSNADPSVYETIANPPFALLQNAAILMQTTVDSLTNNVTLSNENYLAYLRFGTYATKEQLEDEKANFSNVYGDSNVGKKVRLTNFTDTNAGILGSPYTTPEKFREDENGWWWYIDPETNKEYLAVAAPLYTCLVGNTGCSGRFWPKEDEITYYNHGDIIRLNIEGIVYEAMVVDACGACMEATEPLKIDIYVNGPYFYDDPSYVNPDGNPNFKDPNSLEASFAGFEVINDKEGFWVYKGPTNEERSKINDYKNGYIYNAYRDAFKDSNGKDLEGEALVNKVENIIETIYNMQEGYSEYNSSFAGDDTPIEQRTTRPNRTNQFYYSSQNAGFAAGYEGECAWYATGRAAEFLASINSTETWTVSPNGGEFCDSSDAQKFNTGTTPKAGSLVSWKSTNPRNPYGHVAFVEKVNPDGTFDISEAGNSFGLYGSSASSIVRGNNAARRENCEGNGTGCINFQTVTNINYGSNYVFDCFIYLREPKNGGNQ